MQFIFLIFKFFIHNFVLFYLYPIFVWITKQQVIFENRIIILIFSMLIKYIELFISLFFLQIFNLIFLFINKIFAIFILNFINSF